MHGEWRCWVGGPQDGGTAPRAWLAWRVEYLAEPVEGVLVEQGARAAFTVLPGAFGRPELVVALRAGERVVEPAGVGAEVVVFG
jgi:hypothetical protein